MRLLLVADLHYTLRQLDWITDHAAEFDLVVVAGDLLDISSTVPLDAQVASVERWLAGLTALTTVVVSSGNHDLTGRDGDGERSALWMGELSSRGIINDGGTLERGEALVTVCPWWDGPVAKGRLVEQLQRDGERAGPRPPGGVMRSRPWVWVYHWPPDGSLTCWTGKRYYGDADLVTWIAQHGPDIVLTGHVHEPPFKLDGSWADRVEGAWIFNPGRQIGPEPTSVVVDLADGTAVWSSMLGFEELALDGPVPTTRPTLA